MRQLTTGRKGAAQGQARALVVFLHGYGADGSDLLGLGDVLGRICRAWPSWPPMRPSPAWAIPLAGSGFRSPGWTGPPNRRRPRGWRGGRGSERLPRSGLADEGLAPEALALVGFSQGAMMAMHVAPRRAQAVAGVVAISGRCWRPSGLQAEVVVRPPVLLVHGDQDDVVPFGNMEFAGQSLVQAGFEVYGHVMEGTAHGIAPDGWASRCNS
jgi:phospholipase/carboxylesterase